MNTTKQLKFIILLLSLISFLSFNNEIRKVKAAGEAVTISPSALSASTATDVTFSFQPSTEYLTSESDTVTITASSGVTLADCSSSTTDADGDSTDDGSAAVTGGDTYTYTFNLDDTTAAVSGGVDFCVNLTAATGNYYLSFSDSNSNYGTALIYVGSANQVNVTAQVQPALAFVIRNSANDANINVCELGTLSLTTVEECSYRLKITTNLESGYFVQINSDGGLVSGANDIDAIVDDSGAVTAGTEEYGISLDGGSSTTGSVTESPSPINYASDDSPIPTSATTLYSVSGPNDPQSNSTYTSLITHRAAISGSTVSGNYTQTITYTVASNF